MKNFFVLFLLISANVFSQITTTPKDPLVKDPYFNRPQNAPQGEKVKLIHSDFFQKTPEKYNGNPYFSGNVQFVYPRFQCARWKNSDGVPLRRLPRPRPHHE